MYLKFKTTRFLVFFLLFILATTVSAQLHVGGLPKSFSLALAPEASNVVALQAPSLEPLMAEDLQNPLPDRFAVNLPVDIGVESLRKGDFSNETTDIWRLTIDAPGAMGLTLFFDQFNLPPDARLFVYNPTRTQLLGAFTSLNNNKLSTFATALIQGGKLTIEYNAPKGTAQPILHIYEIAWAYRGINQGDGVNTGFGTAGPCEVNVNCSEGAAWGRQKRGVTRVQVKRGGASLFCTGSVVNNTLNDGKPYVLTADHCGRLSSEFDLSQWIFYFNYEGKNCQNPAKEPWLSSITGSKRIAHGGEGGNNGSDFFLVLLNSAIPDSFNVYYNGWSREASPSPSGVTIHHPMGDIKKVSTYTVPLQPSYWSGDAKLCHWKVVWSATENGHSTTELGSSGSPLFDSRGRIVGTLTGGDSSCDSTALFLPDYYGMFSYHWDQNGADSTEQLKPWLDPINADVMSVNGWALAVDERTADDWVQIFPNPVSEKLNIRIADGNHGEIKVKITDLYGNLLKNEGFQDPTGHEYSISVDNLPPGLYFLILNDHQKSAVRKFIKN